MKTIILLLLLGCLAFSQTYKETAKSQPYYTPTTVQTTQKRQESGKSGSNDYWKSQVSQGMKGRHEMTDQQLEEVAQIVAMTVYGAVIVSLIIGGALLFKCMQKRRASKELKNQMLGKKHLYASSMGINLYELNNDPRMTLTIHV